MTLEHNSALGQFSEDSRSSEHDAATLAVSIVRDEASFLRLQNEWSGLLSKMSQGTVFSTFQWHYVWWKYHHQGRRLFIVTVRQGQNLVGVGPFCVERLGWGKVALRRLEFLGTKSTDVCDVLIDPSVPEAIEPLLQLVLEHAKEWDAVDLWQVPTWSPLLLAFQNLLIDGRLQRSIEEQTIERFFSLDQGAWKRTATKDIVGNTRRRRNSLAREGNLELVVCREEGQIDQMLTLMAEMHIQRWRGQGEPSAFTIPSHCHWLAEVGHELFRRGWLYLASLNFNGETVAVGCYFLFRRRLTSYVYSFESGLSRYSPANLLAWMVLERCEADGLADIFDWGEGREEYKAKWTLDYFSLYRLSLLKQYGVRSHLLSGWSQRLKPGLQRQARYWTLLRRAKHRWQGLRERLG